MKTAVQINRGKTTQQIVAEVLKLPSVDSFEGVVLEIGTNDLSNMFPKKGPPCLRSGGKTRYTQKILNLLVGHSIGAYKEFVRW